MALQINNPKIILMNDGRYLKNPSFVWLKISQSEADKANVMLEFYESKSDRSPVQVKYPVGTMDFICEVNLDNPEYAKVIHQACVDFIKSVDAELEVEIVDILNA